MDDSFTLVFGSGDSFYLSGFLIFAVFLKKDYDEDWRIYDITNRNDFVVNDGNINFELKDLGLYAFKRTLDGMFLVSNNILFLKGNLNLFQKKWFMEIWNRAERNSILNELEKQGYPFSDYSLKRENGFPIEKGSAFACIWYCISTQGHS